MKGKFLFRIGIFVALQSISQVSIGQNVENSNFESWFIDGLYQYPIAWTSSNDFSLPIGPAGVSADSSSYDGFLAAKIVTTNIGFAGAPYAGFIVNGSMNVTGHYDIDSIHKAGKPFVERPNALSGYYKYESDAFIEDWGQAFVLLKKYDSINQRIDTIAYGENILLNPSEDYRFFKVDIEYFKKDVQPDSIVVAFFSTYPKHPISGGRLWVDKINLEYTTKIDEIKKEVSFAIYPNPVNSILRVTGEKPAMVKVFNLLGVELLNFQNENQIDVSELPSGVYLLGAKVDKSWLFDKFVKK